MKKKLLILILAFNVTVANAQWTISPAGGVAKQPNKRQIYPELSQPTPLPSVKNQHRHIRQGKPTVDTVTMVTPLGSAGNAFGTAFGSRTNLWYDKNLNTLCFFHRSTIGVDSSTTIGDIRIDYSTDGGTTWINDSDLLYRDTTGQLRGRYPQGVIYNPTGNTNPDSAYVTAYGPTTNGTNWIANYEGTSRISDTTHKQNIYMPINNVIPDGMQIVKNTGTTWVVANGTDANGNTDDSIFLAKGTYNNGDFSYDFTKTFYAFVPDSFGLSDISTAWSDDGVIGYVVRLINDKYPIVDSVLVPQVWKTIDGGNTWSLMTDSTNLNINALDTALSLAGYTMTTGFDVDCALDMNNNLHIAVVIGASPGGYSISSAYGNFGVFDIYTTDGGTTWYGQIVGKPELFRGEFGDGSTANPFIDEDDRPQVTRSWDGSKIFISWFDTDTAEFGGGNLANVNPDWYVRGLDVNSLNLTTGAGNWTDSLNMTDFTAADGFCTFGNLSYYTISNGSNECLPMVYVQLQSPQSTGSVVSFYYVGSGCVDSSSYTMARHPNALRRAYVGINEAKKSGFEVSPNYPNPFNGSTMVDVTLTKPAYVTIEVSNMVGQILSTKTYKGLIAGINHLDIDATGFATGLYLYKVKVGDEKVTRMMAVK